MIENNQEFDLHLPSFAIEEIKSPSTIPSPETLSASLPSLSSNSFASNQKIEIVFPQGHRLCLKGSFDWDELRTWLTPLLTLEK